MAPVTHCPPSDQKSQLHWIGRGNLGSNLSFLCMINMNNRHTLSLSAYRNKTQQPTDITVICYEHGLSLLQII